VLELLTIAEMTEADRIAELSGIPSLALMENAGRAVADAAGHLVAAGSHIVVLCGPGNNGGDGFVAARLLHERGFDVQVALFGSTLAGMKGDAASMAQRWWGPVASMHPSVLEGAALAIDAVFGAGLNRKLPAELERMGASLRSLAIPTLAVDVPSGLDGTTGQVQGTVMPATHTVTFVRRKVGHVLMPGRTLCGDVHVADIGIAANIVDQVGPTVRANTAPTLPPLNPAVHKYQRGHVLVVSGPPLATGASRLAARGALRIGAGAVTLASTPEAALVNAAHLTSIMNASYTGVEAFASLLQNKFHSVAVGPAMGVGERTRVLVRTILSSGNDRGIVLDADALTSFEQEREGLFQMTKRHGRVVMTPHEGEFKRLFGDLPGSKLDRARDAAKISRSVVVLKGADTVVADWDGTAVINENAPPWLATAGSGDVLAGFIAGLLAQGVSAFSAACQGVWLHAECANVFGRGLVAEDLPEVLPTVLRTLKHPVR
jgi:ADP-dependent NAD(P)H-hydrate dehydratase / NAD(P)H-hydrate epimerase